MHVIIRGIRNKVRMMSLFSNNNMPQVQHFLFLSHTKVHSIDLFMFCNRANFEHLKLKVVKIVYWQYLNLS